MNDIHFDDQVALVTGAGGGMGREYAIALARRGARVVVNDYGGSVGGEPGTAARAEAVAAEIEALGGVAVASGEAVGTFEAARAIVDRAVDGFGRLDIIVNNAGIARAGSMDKLDFGWVEAVYRTDLIGAHALIAAAWPVMKRQGHGRILNVSSNAALGIGGNAAYSAAKAGMIGLTLDAAREGASLGIHVNAVMPVAYSRMIDKVPDPAFVAWMRAHFPADKVALAMLPLLARESGVSGRIFSTGGGRIARVAIVEGEGVFLPQITPEAADASLAEIDTLSGQAVLDSYGDELALYTRQFPFGRDSGPGMAGDALARDTPAGD